MLKKLQNNLDEMDGKKKNLNREMKFLTKKLT